LSFVHADSEPVGPYGEHPNSDSYREGVQAAARDALTTIHGFMRGEIEGLRTCRSLVNDGYLREIAPIELLLGFIGVESEFDTQPDDERQHLFEPADWTEICQQRDRYFATVRDSMESDCTALAAHLEHWQRDHPPRVVGE